MKTFQATVKSWIQYYSNHHVVWYKNELPVNCQQQHGDLKEADLVLLLLNLLVGVTFFHHQLDRKSILLLGNNVWNSMVMRYDRCWLQALSYTCTLQYTCIWTHDLCAIAEVPDHECFSGFKFHNCLRCVSNYADQSCLHINFICTVLLSLHKVTYYNWLWQLPGSLFKLS